MDAPPEREEARWFAGLSERDTERVGGKGANLGKVTRIGMPVPPGFVVTAAACRRFLEESGLGSAILQRLAEWRVDDGSALRQPSEELQRQVRDARLPPRLREAVVDAYRTLAERCGSEAPFVAVRSSATAQDVPGASFAGLFTVNPANQDRSALVIEDAFGLGDTGVSGRVSPDDWAVSTETLETNHERLGAKRVLTLPC